MFVHRKANRSIVLLADVPDEVAEAWPSYSYRSYYRITITSRESVSRHKKHVVVN